MKNLIGTATIMGVLALSSAAFADKASAPGQDKTCLITFNSPEAVAGGADADITNTKYLPRKAADKQASKNNTMATFDYGANTQATCSSLDPS